MPFIARPASGQIIDPAWGTLVADAVVMRFTTAAQRASQLTAPVVGQLTQRDDKPGAVEYWTGTAWVDSNEVFYNQITAPLTVTAVAANASQLLIAGSPIVYDGRPVIVELSTPALLTPNVAGGAVTINLIDASTDLGYLGQAQASNPSILAGVTFRRRLTPTAGTHTYQLAAWRTAGAANATVYAGPGGVDQYPPAFMRIVRA
jgi:hypothetical protein